MQYLQFFFYIFSDIIPVSAGVPNHISDPESTNVLWVGSLFSLQRLVLRLNWPLRNTSLDWLYATLVSRIAERMFKFRILKYPARFLRLHIIYTVLPTISNLDTTFELSKRGTCHKSVSRLELARENLSVRI